jgi:hypothetical protein
MGVGPNGTIVSLNVYTPAGKTIFLPYESGFWKISFLRVTYTRCTYK